MPSPPAWHARALELAAEGLDPPAIARKVKRSRQRVHQVLAAHGVTTPAMRGRRKPLLLIRHVRLPKELVDGVSKHARALSKKRRKRVTWSEALREIVDRALQGG